MAGGCCGGAAPGMEVVWQLVHEGQVIAEHPTQAAVVKAKADNNGQGRMQRVHRRLPK